MTAADTAGYEFPDDVPTRPFFEEVTAVYGGRGSGKTTKARNLIVENMPPVVVWIDPTLDVDTSLAELQARVQARDKLVQFSATNPEMAMAALLYCYGMSTKANPVFVVCDEAADYLKLPRNSIRQVFQKGRHAGLGVLLVTQRPSGIHPDFRSQATRTFWGKLTDHNDIALACQKLGREAGTKRQSAQVGDFIEA